MQINKTRVEPGNKAGKINMAALVAEDEVITSSYEYELVITEPEATNYLF